MKTVTVKEKEIAEFLKTLTSDQKAMLKKGLTVLEKADAKNLSKVLSSKDIYMMCECSGTTGEPGLTQW